MGVFDLGILFKYYLI